MLWESTEMATPKIKKEKVEIKYKHDSKKKSIDQKKKCLCNSSKTMKDKKRKR